MSLISRLPRRFRDPLIRRILDDALVSTGAAVVSALLGMGRHAALARYLGMADFGRLAMVVSATALVRQMVSVRAWEWTQVELARAYPTQDRAAAGSAMKGAYLLGLLVNGVTALILLALGPWICSMYLHEPSLALVLEVNALGVLATWADEPSFSALRVTGRYRWLGRYTAGAAALRIAVLAPVVLLDGGLLGVVIGTVAIQAPMSLWLFVATRRSLEAGFGGRLTGSVRDLRGRLREHGRTLAVFSVTDTLKTFAADLDNLVIGAFHSAAAVGPFRAAQTVILSLQQLATPFYMVYYPEMLKAAAAGDGRSVRRLVRQITLLGLAAGGGAALVITICAPWLVRVIYGDAFAQSALPLQVMAWSLLAVSVGWVTPLTVSVGRPELNLLMHLAGATVKVALLFALVSSMPLLGPALAHVGSYAVLIVFAIGIGRAVADRGRQGVPLLR